ncbi:MAG TPA: insulinase family protein [Longimicrobiales bacterium]
MMGWTALLWAALVVPPAWSGVDGAGLGPVEVVTPRGGPRVVYRSMVAPSLVAMRLSVPTEEPPGLRGATRLLQELVREELEGSATAIGARIELERAPGHAVYAIVGPRASFEAMVALLRRAVTRPVGDPREVAVARARVARDALAALELPGARVRTGLLAALFSTADTSAASRRLDQWTAADLEGFRRRYFVPDRMTVVVVGAVSLDAAAAAFTDWPAPAAPPPLPAPSIPADSAPPPQAVARWAGIGWSVEGHDPAVLAVASTLVTRRLAGSGLSRARAELWWSRDRLGFVVVGSALPGSETGTAPAQTLRRAIEQTAEQVRAEDVLDARRSLRHELVFDARTPHGLATLLGRFTERTGDPHAAAAFLDALRRVDAGQVRAALLALVHGPPAVVEVAP